MPENIDDFNRGAALILAHLYRTFPVPCLIKVNELDRHPDLIADETERRDRRHTIYASAIGFLADEGYLRFKSASSAGDVYLHVILTSKGLAALQRTPEVLDVRPKTAGDRLIEAMGMGTTEVAKGIIREAMRVIFGT